VEDNSLVIGSRLMEGEISGVVSKESRRTERVTFFLSRGLSELREFAEHCR